MPCARIARGAGVLPAEAAARSGGSAGPDPTVDAAPCWDARGYQTIIRNNWHLCPFDQLLQLLDMPEERLAFLLKEDDFFWHKLGMPAAVRARALGRARAGRGGAHAPSRKPCVPCARGKNGFDFVAALARRNRFPRGGRRLRTVHSYFAPLWRSTSDPSLDPFPDALLAEYARMGVRGVWLQGILYQLTPFPFDPALSTGWEARIAALNRLIARAKRHGIGVYLYLNEPRPCRTPSSRYLHLRGRARRRFLRHVYLHG